GYFGIRYSESMGGSGLDYWYVNEYIQALCYARNAGLAMAMMVQSEISTPVIDAIGTDGQKREFLKPAIAGDIIGALGITEPDAGSDVAGIRTVARRDGDDYIIDGSKTFITNGTRADFITLSVRTGEEGHGGISLVLFPTETRGFQVSKSLKKLGNWSSDTALLYFDGCRIPRRYLLGEENQGFRYIMENFQGERLAVAMSAVGAMQMMFDDALAYCKERKVFGRPIAKFQVWQHKIAEMATQIEAARQLTYLATDKLNKGENAVKEISMAKLFSGDLAQKVAYDCMQLHGGNGYMAEYDITRSFRDLRLMTIGGGTSEIMKEIIYKWGGYAF
ncbi:MAG TPA: acyl-CoA dehydrogenase, partial [Flavobacteriales bacterium]|nr:acyl-CoA dehydrogenase [Flavobacteriales bacterium]